MITTKILRIADARRPIVKRLQATLFNTPEYDSCAAELTAFDRTHGLHKMAWRDEQAILNLTR